MGSQPLAVCKCGAMTCGAPSPTCQIGQPSACAAGLTDTAASTCASALSSEASNPTPHWARSAAGNRATVTAWGDPCITRLVVCCDAGAHGAPKSSWCHSYLPGSCRPRRAYSSFGQSGQPIAEPHTNTRAGAVSRTAHPMVRKCFLPYRADETMSTTLRGRWPLVVSFARRCTTP